MAAERYVSEELKKVPATQFDIQQVTNKLDEVRDEIMGALNNTQRSHNCELHEERLRSLEEHHKRMAREQVKLWRMAWLAIGGGTVLLAVAEVALRIVKW